MCTNGVEVPGNSGQPALNAEPAVHHKPLKRKTRKRTTYAQLDMWRLVSIDSFKI